MNEDLENMDDDFEDTDDPSDFKEEFEMWKLLAEQEDDAEAQLHLGQIYQYGLGVKEDDKEAVKWYRLAAEQGDASAQTQLGLMLILLGSLYLGWFPSSGFLNPLLFDASVWVRAMDIVWHMCLPLLTIVVGGVAGLIRYNRFGMIKVLAQDYMVAARARGLSEWRLLFKHALKNMLLPLITILGLDLPALISGSYIIEYIFSWPGMGQLGVQSVFQRDYPILMATILFSSCLIILGNVLADCSYALADPRISTGKRKKRR